MQDLLNAGRSLDLEIGLAEFLSVPSVQIESSGTAALIIALNCLKRRSDRREVIVPAYTCPLVALAVKQAGLELKLCDLSKNSYDMDASALARLAGKDTLCVIPTHMAGLPADLTTTLKLAKDVGAYVVEDAAQALGAVWNGKYVGTVGDIGVFSLTCGKGLTIGEGGVLVANDADLRAALLESRAELVTAKAFDELAKIFFLVGYTLFYNPLSLGCFYGRSLRHWLKKGDPVKAVGDQFELPIALNTVGKWRKQVAATALVRLRNTVESNAVRGRSRAALLKQFAKIKVFTETEGTAGTWPFISLLCESQSTRDRILDRLWTSGLGVTRLFIHALTGYEYLSGIVPSTEAPNATDLARRTLTISNSSYVSDRDFKAILDVIAEVSGDTSRNLERKEILFRSKPIS